MFCFFVIPFLVDNGDSSQLSLNRALDVGDDYQVLVDSLQKARIGFDGLAHLVM